MNLNKISRALYKAARVSRDINAVTRGPGAVGKRIVRKTAYRATNQGLARLLRGLFR